MGAAVVAGVWISADVDTVDVRTWLPMVTVTTVSTGICDVMVWVWYTIELPGPPAATVELAEPVTARAVEDAEATTVTVCVSWYTEVDFCSTPLTVVVMTLEVGITDITVAEDWKFETTAEAGTVGRAVTTELKTLVDATTVEDSLATPETVTVTTVDTWTTLLLRTVV
jgi:hypothetical protein